MIASLGELLLDQRRPAEARALFEEALTGQKRVLGPERDETAVTMIDLADTARLQGRIDKARKLALEADAINRRIFGPEHSQTLYGLTVLASIARDQGRFDDARKRYEESLAALKRPSPRGSSNFRGAWPITPGCSLRHLTRATATHAARSSWRTM